MPNETGLPFDILISDFVISTITSVTVSALLTAALVWLSKNLISERLKNAIKDEYDEKLETHKAQLKAHADIEMERLRSQLNIIATEHQVRFSDLHAKRAEVIAKLYRLLVHIDVDARCIASPMTSVDKKGAYISFNKTINTFYQFFDENRIYLPEELYEKIEAFAESIRSRTYKLGQYIEHESISKSQHVENLKHQVMNESWNYLQTEARETLNALAKEFRKILGG